ncbi:MAG: VIT1/CCC1 family protein [Nitrososphaerota archaeon]
MTDFVRYVEDEYRDYVTYRELAKRERNKGRKMVLEQLAAVEYEHYKFWDAYTGRHEQHTPRALINLLVIVRKILGLTFTIKLLERHEEQTINSYRDFASHLSGDERLKVEAIIQEELEHEKTLLSQIDETVVRYLGFVALGLADAIIEITGVHAGFLGVTSSTLIAGIAGLVVGFAAAISMASAAYLQAKHGRSRNPLESALVTGGAYLLTVTVLALPYFMVADMLLAFTASVSLAVAMMTMFTFYGAVISEKKFLMEFLLSLGLVMGTALGTYLFGDFLGSVFGIKQHRFF